MYVLPEIVIKFLAESLCCRTNELVLLKGIDVVLDVLDSGEHHVDGRVGLAIELVGHLLDGFEEGNKFSMSLKSSLTSINSSFQSNVETTLLRALVFFLLIRISLSIMSTSVHQRVTT